MDGSGTATAFVSPLLVGFFTVFHDGQPTGLASLVGLLVAELVMMIYVKEAQATKLEA